MTSRRTDHLYVNKLVKTNYVVENTYLYQIMNIVYHIHT